MKVLKIIAISFLSLLIILAIGGYIFFKKVFTPDPNYLELTECSNFVPIEWIKSEHSDIAGLFLPVKIKGIPHTFYLQFDTGSPSTLLYKQTLLSIREKYPDQIAVIDSTSITIDQTLQIGDMEIHSKQFKLYDHQKRSIDWGDSTIIKIGTLGADIIDKKLTILDFKNHQCYFGEKLPELGKEVIFQDLKFKKRRVLIPAVIEGKASSLLHDTGTSGFELITNEKTWNKLSKKGAEAEEAFKVKSWKRTLTAFNIESDKKINFKASEISLNQVTFIKGASFMQHMLMRMTGMGGMIGNQLFMGKMLILDCKNEKYSIVDMAAP